MTDKLLDYCSKYIQLTESDIDAIKLYFKVIKLRRKDFLLKEGYSASSGSFIYFLQIGARFNLTR